MDFRRLAISLLTTLTLPALAQNTPQAVVIRTGTRVVLVNVVAQDKHGKPVSDLQRDDFTLRDNGEERKIELFAIEKAARNTSAAAAPGELAFSNRPGASGVIVFLFDQLNTSLTDQELAKRDFLGYLRGLRASSRVAVFSLGDSLTLLHDFTEDQAALVEAVTRHGSRANPEVTAATASAASANSLVGDESTDAKLDSFVQSARQPYVDYTETVRAKRTAAALETIAAHVEGIPGRKTLIWISGGFPIQLGLRNYVDSVPDNNSNSRTGGRRGSDGGKTVDTSAKSLGTRSNSPDAGQPAGGLPGTGTSFESDVERAVRALNEADVAVYSVNARGVTVAGPYQADRSSIGGRGQSMSGRSSGRRVKEGGAIPNNFDDETLELLAEETGGKAFHHINDLESAIEDATADARVSYSLAFAAPESALDGSYHHIEVTAQRQGVKLRYRPGYAALREPALAESLSDAVANPVNLAGVGFTVHLEQVEGGYKASAVIDPRAFRAEDGKWVGSIEFMALVGKVEQLMSIPMHFDEAVYRNIQNQGLHCSARVKTQPGVTAFTLGFRDVPSGAVGTLHVKF